MTLILRWGALRGGLREKGPRDRRRWETRLWAQVATLPDFDQVAHAVQRALGRLGVA